MRLGWDSMVRMRAGRVGIGAFADFTPCDRQFWRLPGLSIQFASEWDYLPPQPTGDGRRVPRILTQELSVSLVQTQDECPQNGC